MGVARTTTATHPPLSPPAFPLSQPSAYACETWLSAQGHLTSSAGATMQVSLLDALRYFARHAPTQQQGTLLSQWPCSRVRDLLFLLFPDCSPSSRHGGPHLQEHATARARLARRNARHAGCYGNGHACCRAWCSAACLAVPWHSHRLGTLAAGASSRSARAQQCYCRSARTL